MLSFETLRIANVERLRQSFPQCKHWTGSDWVTATCGEVGEAANIVKKLNVGSGTVTIGDLAKELADVQTYLDLWANHYGIDLAQATIDKFNEVSQRDFVKSPIRLTSEV